MITEGNEWINFRVFLFLIKAGQWVLNDSHWIQRYVLISSPVDLLQWYLIHWISVWYKMRERESFSWCMMGQHGSNVSL